MTLDSLQERLAQLQETTAQLKDLIDRLATLRFQPGSVPLDASVASIASDAASVTTEEGQNAAAELVAEIAQAMRDGEDDLELLREDVAAVRVPRRGAPGEDGGGGRKRVSLHDSPGGSEVEKVKGRLEDGVTRVEEELKSCHLLFRKAQLSARQSLQQAQKQERALLMASYAAAPPSSAGGAGSPTTARSAASSPAPSLHRRRQHRHHHQQREEQHHASAETSASASVTAALRQMHALAATEVARSEFAQQALADSSAALNELGERYGALGGALAASRAMVGRLLGGAKSDTWFLEAALWVLCATAGWILFRRLLYGPLWLLVWWPVRTGWRVVGGAVGMVGGGAAGEQQQPSMVVVDGGSTRVVGMMSEGSVPTVSVGVGGQRSGSGSSSSSSTREGEEEEEEAMVDKVGRVVDGGGEGDGEGGNPKKRVWEEGTEEQQQEAEGGEQQGGNPMKRMWEEDREAAKAKGAAGEVEEGGREKDEL